MTKNDSCNICGHTCKLAGNKELYGLQTEVNGGYHSTPGNGDGALDDLMNYKFSICEFCLDDLFQDFIIPVKLDDGDGDRHIEFKPAAQRIQEDVWRKDKFSFIAEYSQRQKSKKYSALLKTLDNINKVPEVYFGPNYNTQNLLNFLMGWDAANKTNWCNITKELIKSSSIEDFDNVLKELIKMINQQKAEIPLEILKFVEDCESGLIPDYLSATTDFAQDLIEFIQGGYIKLSSIFDEDNKIKSFLIIESWGRKDLDIQFASKKDLEDIIIKSLSHDQRKDSYCLEIYSFPEGKIINYEIKQSVIISNSLYNSEVLK